MIPKKGDKVKITEDCSIEECVLFSSMGLTPETMLIVTSTYYITISFNLDALLVIVETLQGREYRFYITSVTGQHIIFYNYTGSTMFEPWTKDENVATLRETSGQDLKQQNSLPSATCCAKCGGPLKQPAFNIKFCPTCEK